MTREGFERLHTELDELVTTGGTIEYRLVGAAEAEPSRRRISVESPVGQALLGRAAGETVEVDAPSGRRRLEIVAVDYAGEAKAA